MQAALLGGVIAGTIDIGAASLISGRDPTIIAQFIAGGLLGKAALTGGAQTVGLGILLQWAMSILIAAIYVFTSAWLVALRRQWLLFGIAYGVPVYFVMTYIVVPLSAWHRVAAFSLVPFAENLAAMMVFGLIVAYFASKADAR
jgi:hypothetical protein